MRTWLGLHVAVTALYALSGSHTMPAQESKEPAPGVGPAIPAELHSMRPVGLPFFRFAGCFLMYSTSPEMKLVAIKDHAEPADVPRITLMCCPRPAVRGGRRRPRSQWSTWL